MSTIAQLEMEVQKLREEVTHIKGTIKLVTGVDADEIWVSTGVAAESNGISISLLKRLIDRAEERRLNRRDTQLQYGVHYRQKPGTRDRQINMIRFREWFNLPPEQRDQ